MSENSSIEWTDTTWNPVTGCTKVSPGCAHCYAETFAERWRGVPGHPYEQGFDLKLWPERLGLPLTWKKPRRVFVNSMSDLFHEDVPFEFIDRVFAVMALTPQHTYQVLTKRPERMREWGNDERRMSKVAERIDRLANETQCVDWIPELLWPLPNVWLGTSVELQRWADVRIPELLATPAAVRFLSCEPLLGPLFLTPYFYERWGWQGGPANASNPAYQAGWGDRPSNGSMDFPHVNWVIVGGESGPGARPFDLAWARSIVSQCQAAGVAVFVKQLGAKAYNGGDMFAHQALTALSLKSRKGGDMAEWPEALRVREFPPSPPGRDSALPRLGEGRTA